MTVRASVAMAVYQGEKYLKRQLDSIISQLGDDDELVLSYDPSTDRTWEIINAYAAGDGRIFVVTDKGQGVVDNFNNALAHCRGKYRFIADQDDIWLPGKIEGMIMAFERTGASLIVHNGVTIDETDAVVSDDFFSTYRIGPSFWRNFFQSRYSGCCMAFTAKFASLVLPIPRDCDAYDRYLALCAERFALIAFIDEVFIHHRLHGNNVTPKKNRTIDVLLKTRWKMWRTLKQKGQSMGLQSRK